ncbi:MAG TPA: TetR/AcrR family transcriptional regulator [Capillimicrobium sp.]|nr:TetR/AcrR family transcriptional regulator [Capillimicrobium sp.]
MNPKVKDPGWSGDPLPRGRHKLPREAVKASQRERLLRAMAEVAAGRGFDATSVAQVVAAARVSTNTFYGFFADKTDCFIALCEEEGERLLSSLEAQRRDAGEPSDALAALDDGLRVYLGWWEDRPALARAYFVELPAAGARALAERDRQLERFAGLLRQTAERARTLLPGLPPVRDLDVRAAAVMANELVAAHVRAGRAEHLDELLPDLRYLMLRLLVSDEVANRVAPPA